MASSSFTPNLGLCQWTANDRPKRADFIADNTIIDSVVSGHISDTDAHMSAEEKSKALTPFVITGYAGTGESTQTISLPFRPTAVFVFKKNDAPVLQENGVTVINSGWAIYANGGTSGVGIGSTGVTVHQEATASNGRRLNLNEDDSQYAVIAFK